MRNSPKYYTKEEIDWLKENYPIYGSIYCADKLNLSIKQIRSKIERLELKKIVIDTTQEINFIKENYPIHGSIYCSKQLNISLDLVRGRVGRLKLNKIDKVDIEQFKIIKTKEVSYILGLIWADGTIRHGNSHISISIINDDMIHLKHIFMKTGNWNYNIINLDKYGYKQQGRIDIGNVKLHEILSDYGFKEKSTISPTRLLESIPQNLHHYFLRGLVDGDGCFYINKKHHTYQFCISSTINQDWDYMIQICNKLNVNYRIDITNTFKSKSSSFRICRKKDVITLGNYIYQDFSFGLDRKYQKFLEIKNS